MHIPIERFPPQPNLSVRIATHLPKRVRSLIPEQVKHQIAPLPVRSATYKYLLELMLTTYNVDNLVGVDRAEFKGAIDAFLALEDASMEGYQGPDNQRDKSIRFYWPYDHDFGDFKVGPGTGRYRHVDLLSTFIDRFGAIPRDLTGKKVLDIGCYLGGPSLLLSAMGAEVVAIEEVKKYVDCLSYVRDSFGLESLQIRNLSLYDLTADEFQDAFDIVLFAGVLYHLSDPVLGMRITFDALKPGGTCLLETGAMRSSERVCEYGGKYQRTKGKGANWFFPSPLVVTEMMDEVGYTDVRPFVQFLPHRQRDRVLAVATKTEQVDMLRAGLSVPTIR
jgi:SAM-dependent methyltransferase